MKQALTLIGKSLIALMSWLSTLLAQEPPAQQSATLALPEGEKPIRVEVSFRLYAIHHINDESETFKFSGILALVWEDPAQVFDPAHEGVDEKLYNGAFQFNEVSPGWYPQVVMTNATDLDNSQAVLLRVQPDGRTTLIQTITAEARSRLNLRRYPLDTQRLEAEFKVLGFDDDEVVLELGKDKPEASLSDIQVPQWDLMGVEAEILTRQDLKSTGEGSSSVFVLTFNVDRQAFFMVRLVIIPLIMIVGLSFSVFWMDRSSLGDRMSVSFVGILTAVAYQIMVSDIMPQISYITLMNAILNFSFLVMCATVVINLVVGSLDNKGQSQRGERLDLRCRWLFPLAYAGLLLISALVTFLVL